MHNDRYVIWPDPSSKVKVKVTHVALEGRHSSIFQIHVSSAIFSGSWKVTADSWTTGKYLNLIVPDFWYLPYFLCHVILNLEENWDATFQSGSQKSTVSPACARD